jgi:hypothetical protein
MCQHASSAALLGAANGRRWEEAMVRTVATRAAEEEKAAAHVSGGKLVMPKPQSSSGSLSCYQKAAGSNAACCSR